MTVKEYYAQIGGDYADVMSRLMKEERVLKYLRMFSTGTDYAEMDIALAEERWEDAFRNAHNLKGISLNLALTPLAKASSVLCEAIRHGKPTEDISGMVAEVEDAYRRVNEAIAMIG